MPQIFKPDNDLGKFNNLQHENDKELYMQHFHKIFSFFLLLVMKIRASIEYRIQKISKIEVQTPHSNLLKIEYKVLVLRNKNLNHYYGFFLDMFETQMIGLFSLDKSYFFTVYFAGLFYCQGNVISTLLW